MYIYKYPEGHDQGTSPLSNSTYFFEYICHATFCIYNITVISTQIFIRGVYKINLLLTNKLNTTYLFTAITLIKITNTSKPVNHFYYDYINPSAIMISAGEFPVAK